MLRVTLGPAGLLILTGACLSAAAAEPVCPGRGLVFGDRQTNLHAVACGAGYVWCGLCTGNTILKVDPRTMTGQVIVMKGQGGLHDLCFDGQHVWGAHASGHTTRIDPLTHAVRTVRTPGFAYTCLFDGRDVWVGMYTDPGTVLRLDRGSLECRSFSIPAAPMCSVRAVASDGRRIWVALYTVPAMVAVLSPGSCDHQVLVLGKANELTLATSIVFDGESIWVGLDSMPAALVKIDPATFHQEVYPLPPQSSCCRALVATRDCLWAGLYTEPAQIVRIDRASGTCRVVTLPGAYFNTRAMAEDGRSLWIGLQNVRYGPSALYGLPMAGPFPGAEVYRFAASACVAESRLRREPLADEAGHAPLTSQDWYRVRRGEDQIAWGQAQRPADLAGVVLSRRAAAELAFLEPPQRAQARSRLAELGAGSAAALSRPVSRGASRRLSPVGTLRIVFQPNQADGQIHVSTIRKEVGKAFDPEVMGPAPR